MKLFKRSATGLFASESLIGHLLRGVIGILLIILAFELQAQSVLSFVSAIGALLAFRGCPVCWTFGLVESVMQKIKRSK